MTGPDGKKLTNEQLEANYGFWTSEQGELAIARFTALRDELLLKAMGKSADEIVELVQKASGIDTILADIAYGVKAAEDLKKDMAKTK